MLAGIGARSRRRRARARAEPMRGLRLATDQKVRRARPAPDRKVSRERKRSLRTQRSGAQGSPTRGRGRKRRRGPVSRPSPSVRAAPAVAARGMALHELDALGDGDVVGELLRRVLDHRHGVAVGAEEPLNGLPARAVDETAVNEDDAHQRSLPFRRPARPGSGLPERPPVRTRLTTRLDQPLQVMPCTPCTFCACGC